MAWTIARALIYGLIGFICLPIITALLVLILGYLFDPRCGTPGDSGGCEMGAATIGGGGFSGFGDRRGACPPPGVAQAA